jgi:hypothetical protein
VSIFTTEDRNSMLCFSETMVSTHEPMQCQNPQELHHPHCCENLMSHKYNLTDHNTEVHKQCKSHLCVKAP